MVHVVVDRRHESPYHHVRRLEIRLAESEVHGPRRGGLEHPTDARDFDLANPLCDHRRWTWVAPITIVGTWANERAPPPRWAQSRCIAALPRRTGGEGYDRYRRCRSAVRRRSEGKDHRLPRGPRAVRRPNRRWPERGTHDPPPAGKGCAASARLRSPPRRSDRHLGPRNGPRSRGPRNGDPRPATT